MAWDWQDNIIVDGDFTVESDRAIVTSLGQGLGRRVQGSGLVSFLTTMHVEALSRNLFLVHWVPQEDLGFDKP